MASVEGSEAQQAVEHVNAFHSKLQQLQDAITDDLPTAAGMSYLQVKNHALLNYTKMALCFALTKLEAPEKLQNHGIFKELVRYRTLLERIRPLDRKMKYQIDKLLKVAASGGNDVDESLNYAPNPDQLVTRDGDQDDEEADSEDDAKKKDGIYKAPRLAAVHYEEEEREDIKKAKREERNRKRLQKSVILSELREEFSERPEEILASGSSALDKELAREEAEKKDYEESRFVRLVTSRKDKIRKRQREREAMAADSVATIDNFAGIQDVLALDKQKHRIPRASADPSKGNGRTGGIFAHVDASVDSSKRRKLSKSSKTPAPTRSAASAPSNTARSHSSNGAQDTAASTANKTKKKKKVVFGSIF